MAEKLKAEYSTLLLALITGMSINGTINTLFDTSISFSIFPIIALVLSIYCLHQRYVSSPMPDGMPSLATGCFLLGIFLYSSIIRVEYHDMGSNFIPVIISVILVFWIAHRFKVMKRLAE